MKTFLTLLLAIIVLPLLSACATPSQIMADAEVRRLCEIDGGIKVYETVKLLAEQFTTGDTVINGTGNELDNKLSGNNAANILTGAAGNDRLNGKGGNDTLIGGAGNDVYILGRGYDSDTVIENDSSAGNNDIVRFLSDINADQIWFQHVGDNLEVSIIGTDDKLVISDWYLGPANRIERFKTSDGLKLFDNQVEELVNAMSGFAVPVIGQTELFIEYAAVLDPVIASLWV